MKNIKYKIKLYILKTIAKTKSYWFETSDGYEFAKEDRRRRVKDITTSLLDEPLSERLLMLKKINDVVLIQSHKEQAEYNEFVSKRQELLQNFKL